MVAKIRIFHLHPDGSFSEWAKRPVFGDCWMCDPKTEENEFQRPKAMLKEWRAGQLAAHTRGLDGWYVWLCVRHAREEGFLW